MKNQKKVDSAKKRWSTFSSEERVAIMANLNKIKYSKMSKAKRKKHALMMAEARWGKEKKVIK